jgi:hypothetical protein
VEGAVLPKQPSSWGLLRILSGNFGGPWSDGCERSSVVVGLTPRPPLQRTTNLELERTRAQFHNNASQTRNQAKACAEIRKSEMCGSTSNRTMDSGKFILWNSLYLELPISDHGQIFRGH